MVRICSGGDGASAPKIVEKALKMTSFKAPETPTKHCPCHVHHSSPKSSQNDLKPLSLNGSDHPTTSNICGSAPESFWEANR
jgi:hypothetical protein